MKINTHLDFQGNEIKLAAPEKVTALPDSNLFVGRTCILISEKEVDESTINVGSMYYYNGEQWCHIEEPFKIDETKINVIDDEITLHKFDTLANVATYIKSNDKPKSVIIGSNTGITSIDRDVFKNCRSLASISIPSGVTSIGVNAFNACTSLTSITIPSGVTSIGGFAFYTCKSLTSITIPSGVTSIDAYTFFGCTSLASISIPSSVTSIGDSAFQNCISLKSISIYNVTSISSYAFYNCTSLTSITIPDSVTSIGKQAFYNCKSLTFISMPPSDVISIASNAFSGCDILLLDNYKSKTGYPWGATDILIQNEDVTTTLDSNSTDRQVPTAKTVYDALSSSSLDQTKINVMCDGDPKLYTFTTIADAVTYINSTDTSKHVIIGSNAGVTSIGNQAFKDCTALTSIDIPSGVTSIGSHAFMGCTSLESITIPNTVTSIGASAFAGCTSLTSITIPSSVTSIGDTAFLNCTSLTSISIPSGVTSISDYTFTGCTSLESINMPNSVTSIGILAFNNCKSLTSITLPNAVTSIGFGAFMGCDILLLDDYESIPIQGYPWGATDILIHNEKVTTTLDSNSTDRQVPTAKTVYDALSSSGGSSLDQTKINVIDDEITVYKFNTLSDAATYISSNNKPKSVVIGSNAGITGIDNGAFANCRFLVFINIPNSVTSIGSGAFYNCPSLKSITIPSNVTNIGVSVFTGCTSLESINIPNSVSVTSIGSQTFQNCTSLKSITIPNSVTSIGDEAFAGCTSLTFIIIPDDVTSIGANAFAGCTSLKSITIPDSITSIGNNAFYGCDILLLDNYKSRTGYPWGATDILIHNEKVTTTLDSNSTDRQVPTAKTVYDALSSSGGSSLDQTKINVMREGDPKLYTFTTIANAVTFINSKPSLKHVVIGSNAGVTSIGEDAFNSCTSLTSITIPSTVTSIGSQAFEYCTSLTSITIPSSVTSIDSQAFYGCTSLKSITIPSGVTSIGASAFAGCTSLTSITIPSSVTSIGSMAFNNCTALTSITIPSSVTSIGTNAFVHCDIFLLDNYKSRTGYPWGASKIYIQNEKVTTTIDENSTDRQVPTAKTVYDTLSSSISSLDDTKINVMCDGDPKVYTFTTIADTKTFINSTDTPKHVVIGNSAGVTSIGGQEFYDCSSLTSITIPNSVTSIGQLAFVNCSSLASITIPSSVTSIGAYAFDGCTSLKSITIPNSVTSIIAGAFRHCTSLARIDIPSSVTSISDETFSGCTSLTYITIPSTVTSIGEDAFNSCTALTSITIPSTVTSIDSTAFQGCDILLLDNYKSRTGYPWGADILIQNEKVTTTIDENSTDRQVPTAKAVYNFTKLTGERYGFRIDKNNSDPDTRVEYLYDAIGMTPAKMTYDETTHKGTFSYGSWGNIWFIKNNRPVKLNFNGTVEAELNPNDYWKTVDGQDSELETSTNCNFMSEIPIVYVKRWEDENYNYVVVCDKQYDEDYLAYANTDKDGNIKPLYAPMFKGYKDSSNRLRSIAGVDPLNSTTTSNEVTYSNNVNTAGSVTGWQIEDIAKHELISDLLTLISKNTNCQVIFGRGVCNTSTRVFTGYNETVTEEKTVKSDCGQFCGYDDNVHHVNIFHIQDFWGNRFDRCLGLVTYNSKYYYKMTPEDGGYTYTSSISNYTNNGYTIAKNYSGNDITPPSVQNTYIKNLSTGIFGNLPIETGGTSTTYYCDYYWYNSSGVHVLLFGGRYNSGWSCGTRFFSLDRAPSEGNAGIGASPFYV